MTQLNGDRVKLKVFQLCVFLGIVTVYCVQTSMDHVYKILSAVNIEQKVFLTNHSVPPHEISSVDCLKQIDDGTIKNLCPLEKQNQK